MASEDQKLIAQDCEVEAQADFNGELQLSPWRRLWRVGTVLLAVVGIVAFAAVAFNRKDSRGILDPTSVVSEFSHHQCYSTASSEYSTRKGHCQTELNTAKSKCAGAKYNTCLSGAYRAYNLCINDAYKCNREMIMGCYKKQMLSASSIKACATEFVESPPGAAVVLASGNIYEFYSQAGCPRDKWCNRAVYGQTDPRLLKYDYGDLTSRYLTPFKVVAAGGSHGSGQFYIRQTHLCEYNSYWCDMNLTISNDACPHATSIQNAAAGVDYKCRMAKFLKADEGTIVPFTFAPVTGKPDQFTITTNFGCPGGQYCGWQLTTDEQHCARQAPVLTVEPPGNLAGMSYTWRLALRK